MLRGMPPIGTEQISAIPGSAACLANLPEREIGRRQSPADQEEALRRVAQPPEIVVEGPGCWFRGLFSSTVDILGLAHSDIFELGRGELALARHELTDVIPARIDIAIPRGGRAPALRSPVDIHVFAAETFAALPHS